jgi:rhamnogalacturonyl hydrolase YesR
MKATLLAAATAVLLPLVAAQRPYSTWMADSFLQKSIAKSYSYQQAVLYWAIDLTGKASGNATYSTWVQQQVDGVVTSTGAITGYPASKDSLDDVLFGRVLLSLYTSTGQAKYKTAAARLRGQLNYQKRTPSGGFWHRVPTYPNQMWLDGIYMADVLYAQWTAAFEPTNTTAWNDILLQFNLIEQHTRNSTTKLLVHGYDESKTQSWANPVTGASPNVWDRAVGWYFMALLDTLDYFPASHPGRQKLQGWFVDLANGLVAAQDTKSGGWWLVMNEPYPGAKGNYIESSATAMFTYGLLKGVRKGYITGTKYTASATKAYDLMTSKFVAKNATGGLLNWEGTVSVGSLGSDASFKVQSSLALLSLGLGSIANPDSPVLYRSRDSRE